LQKYDFECLLNRCELNLNIRLINLEIAQQCVESIFINPKERSSQINEDSNLDVVYKQIDSINWNMVKHAGFSLSVVEMPNEPISYLAIGLYN